MDRLPRRGPGARELGLAIPPARMPLLRGGRPLKRWRYAGVYGPELMLCAGDARVGPLPVRWWAIAEPGRALVDRTTLIAPAGVEVGPRRVEVRADGARISLELEPAGDAMEVVSPSDGSYIWTGKRPFVARGTVEVGGRRSEIECGALIDDSAGYHARVTEWRWSAGVGVARGGERVAWNVVTGVHDAPRDSERTVWVDGRASEVGPVEFAGDLSSLSFADGGSLAFEEWSARVDNTNVGFFSNVYRQPFGTFTGTLPGGLELAEGYGVMEEHSARW
jgi:hypothetical protein